MLAEDGDEEAEQCRALQLEELAKPEHELAEDVGATAGRVCRPARPWTRRLGG